MSSKKSEATLIEPTPEDQGAACVPRGRRIFKLLLLTAVPAGVVMLIGPVVALAGTVAVTSPSELTT
jgi:hypothetical protein